MTEVIDTGTGEIAVREPDSVLQPGELPAETVEQVERFLTGDMLPANDDPKAISLRIMATLLNAETPEEVLADAEATGLREVLEQPFIMTGVSFHESTYEEGLPFYCVLRGTDVETGENVVYTSGAQSVVAQAFRLAQRGWLPQKVQAKTSKKATKTGFFPVRLVQVP